MAGVANEEEGEAVSVVVLKNGFWVLLRKVVMEIYDEEMESRDKKELDNQDAKSEDEY